MTKIQKVTFWIHDTLFNLTCLLDEFWRFLMISIKNDKMRLITVCLLIDVYL